MILSFTCLKSTHQRTSPSFFFTGTRGELYSDSEACITPCLSQSCICSSRDSFIVGFSGLTLCLIGVPGVILISSSTRSVTPTCPSFLVVNMSAYLVISALAALMSLGSSFSIFFSSNCSSLITSSALSDVCIWAICGVDRVASVLVSGNLAPGMCIPALLHNDIV